MKRREIIAALGAGGLLSACGGGNAEESAQLLSEEPRSLAPPPDGMVKVDAGSPAVRRPPPRPPTPAPPPPSSEGILLDTARTMQAGEWRHIPTVLPAEYASFQTFQYVRAIPPATGGADGMGWTERLVLHDGELMLLLMRDAFEKSFIRMDRNGVWTRTRQPQGFPLRYERRPFNRMVSDGEYLYHFPADAKVVMGYAMRTPLDNPGVFERFGISIGDDQMDTVGNFATNYSPEWGRFLAYTPGGKVFSWAPGETSWKRHDDNIPAADSPSGFAGTILWNPIRHEALAIGGQTFGSNSDRSYKVLVLRDPAGQVEQPFDAKLPDGSPMLAITSGSSRFLVHPTTGEYWCLYRNGSIYRSESGEHWRFYQDTTSFKPFGSYEQYCPMTWLTDDVIVGVSHIKGVFLHRIGPNGQPPAPPPPADPPPPAEPVSIALAIQGMREGEVRLVSSNTSHFKVAATKGTYWIIDWNPRMHWDAQSRQLILCGHRIAHRFVAFSESAGVWRDLPKGPYSAEGGSGHWYGWSADDGQGGIYAKGARFDIASETWTSIPAAATTNGSHGTMYAWLASVGRLARFGGDIQRWQEYDPATAKWTTYANRVGHGQHALVEYHPQHECCLMLGGNASTSKASLMYPGGVLKPMPDIPGRTSMSGGSWIVAHPDGGWLVRVIIADNTTHIFHFRPTDGRWQDLGAFPKLGQGYQTAAIDPARRIVLIAATTGLHVWKIPTV